MPPANTVAFNNSALQSDSDRMNRPTGIPQHLSNEYDDFFLAKKLQEEEDHAYSVHTSARDNHTSNMDILNPETEFHRLGLSPEEIELIKNEEAYYDSKKNQRNQRNDTGLINNIVNMDNFTGNTTAGSNNNANPTRNTRNQTTDKSGGCIIM